MKKILVTAIMLCCSISAQANWTQSISEDEMSGEKSVFIHGPDGTRRDIPWPHSGDEATLIYRCSDRSFYIWTDTNNLTDDTTEDGYNAHFLLVKKDDDSPFRMDFIQRWGSKFFHPLRSEEMEFIKNSREFKIQFPAYSIGNVVYTFEVSGFDESLCQIN